MTGDDFYTTLKIMVMWGSFCFTTVILFRYGRFSKCGYPNSQMVHFVETPFRMDDNLGYPHDFGNLRF